MKQKRKYSRYLYTLLFLILAAAVVTVTGSCGSGGGDGGGTSGSSGGGDATPPTVSSTSPALNAANVAINTAITATFSEAMDASTITTATFTVGGVTGTVTYTGTTATFTPTTSLAYSTTYTATITTGAKDLAGNAMAANYSWSFTTASASVKAWKTAALIETDNAGTALAPQIAFDSSGNAIAVWTQSDGARYNIYANRYVSATGWGAAALIETDNAGDAYNPQIAFDSSGNAIAVWHQDDGTRNNIYANRYVSATGWGAAALIETDNAGDAYNPQIAFDSSGNAIAVWYQWDGTRFNIYANRYASGTGWGAAALIETDNAGSAYNPQIAFDSSGNAIAVWYQYDGTRNNIYANRYATGTGWGAAALIETDNAETAWAPRLPLIHQAMPLQYGLNRTAHGITSGQIATRQAQAGAQQRSLKQMQEALPFPRLPLIHQAMPLQFGLNMTAHGITSMQIATRQAQAGAQKRSLKQTMQEALPLPRLPLIHQAMPLQYGLNWSAHGITSWQIAMCQAQAGAQQRSLKQTMQEMLGLPRLPLIHQAMPLQYGINRTAHGITSGQIDLNRGEREGKGAFPFSSLNGLFHRLAVTARLWSCCTLQIYTLSSSLKYSSLLMFTVRILFLIISTPTSSYSGITTARFAPWQVKTWWEPSFLLYLHPNNSKIFICVFQSVGYILGIRQPEAPVFQIQSSHFLVPQYHL